MTQVTLKKTASQASIYGLGAALSRSVGIIMLPIYTRYLSPEDYGVVSLLVVTAEIASLMFGLNIGAALYRFFFESNQVSHQNKVMCTAMTSAIILKSMAVVFVITLSGSAANLVFGDESYQLLIAVYAATLVTDALINFPMMYLRALERPWTFVGIGVCKLALQVTLNIIFVVVLEEGVVGVIKSTVLAGLATGIPLTIWTYARVGWSFDGVILRRIVAYSWPLVLTGFIGLIHGSVVAQVGLSLWAGLSAVGLYALGYSIASVISVAFISPFMQSWDPQRFQIVKQEDGAEICRRIFRITTTIIIFLASCASILAWDALRVMSASDFWTAAYAVPGLSVGIAFGGVSLLLRTGLLVSGRTKQIMVAEFLAAIVFASGVWLSKGHLNATIVSVAYAISKVTEVIWIHFQSRKDYDMNIQWKPFVAASLVGLAAFSLSRVVSAEVLTSLLINSSLCAAVGLTLFFSPVTEVAIRRKVISTVRIFIYAKLNLS